MTWKMELSKLELKWVLLWCVARHFLKSPNFDGWFRSRQKEMTQKLEALHLEALCNEVRKTRAYDYLYLL